MITMMILIHSFFFFSFFFSWIYQMDTHVTIHNTSDNNKNEKMKKIESYSTTTLNLPFFFLSLLSITFLAIKWEKNSGNQKRRQGTVEKRKFSSAFSDRTNEERDSGIFNFVLTLNGIFLEFTRIQKDGLNRWLTPNGYLVIFEQILKSRQQICVDWMLEIFGQCLLQFHPLICNLFPFFGFLLFFLLFPFLLSRDLSVPNQPRLVISNLPFCDNGLESLAWHNSAAAAACDIGLIPFCLIVVVADGWNLNWDQLE